MVKRFRSTAVMLRTQTTHSVLDDGNVELFCLRKLDQGEGIDLSQSRLVMNSYLTVLVEELKQGWENGFGVTTYNGVQVNVRVALSCIACDIPASRKVSGFLGHHASLACNKCLKHFL